MHSLINAFPHPYSQHSSIRITQSTVRFLYAFSPLTQGTVRFTFNPLSIRFTFLWLLIRLIIRLISLIGCLSFCLPSQLAIRSSS